MILSLTWLLMTDMLVCISDTEDLVIYYLFWFVCFYGFFSAYRKFSKKELKEKSSEQQSYNNALMSEDKG